MPKEIRVRVKGKPLKVPAGTSAAVAAMMAGVPSRTSVGGEPRAPLCAMGVCFECRMKINGRAHVRSCQVPCVEGMEVEPDE
jgi:D-hydroxyproline dehydrogenase subunit gamma